jgi:hypothetical protein
MATALAPSGGSPLNVRISILSWRAFDALLRGKMIAAERVRLMSVWVAWQVLCAAAFGLSLGVYALTCRETPDIRYMLADLIKMPLLLLLTSGVTVPSLYVFGALRGLRFSAREFAAMLMVAHTILAAVLGSLAPVVAFFALTTLSYSFMVLLTVFACVLAGFLGIRVFVRAINEPAPDASGEAPSTTPVATAETPSAPAGLFSRPAHIDKNIWQLLGWWVALYAFVGAQMGWMLRPFIGSPELQFILFRGKGGSLVESVIHHLRQII